MINVEDHAATLSDGKRNNKYVVRALLIQAPPSCLLDQNILFQTSYGRGPIPYRDTYTQVVGASDKVGASLPSQASETGNNTYQYYINRKKSECWPTLDFLTRKG